MVNRALEVAAGIAADRLLGEPPAHLHPLPRFGSAMERLEALLYSDHRVSGALYCAAGTLLGAAAGAATRSTAIATYVSTGARSLSSIGRRIGNALETGDLEEARAMLPALVGRDPSSLDEKEIARAVVESLAENTVDALVAPAFWALVGGAPGALAYRAVNTLDAMVAHRSERYMRFGWASARLDDAAGWVPARLTAALLCVLRPTRRREIIEVVRTQASAHPSPNAGVSEGAFAAALGLRLGGENRYGDRIELRPALGDGRAAEPADIERAARLADDVAVALIAILGAAGMVVSMRNRSARHPAQKRSLAP